MRRKILTAALLGVLISISSSGMTLSYLTDSDESISNFTVGRVSIKSIKTESGCSNILSGGTCTQLIQTKNTGNSPAYIRVRIAVPADISERKFEFDYSNTSPLYIARTSDVKISDKEYKLYDFYYRGQVDPNKSPDLVEAQFRYTEQAKTETENSESCTPEEGKDNCMTEAENVSVNIKDVGIKIYTQAIQATGFNSVEEAFKKY